MTDTIKISVNITRSMDATLDFELDPSDPNMVGKTIQQLVDERLKSPEPIIWEETPITVDSHYQRKLPTDDRWNYIDQGIPPIIPTGMTVVRVAKGASAFYDEHILFLATAEQLENIHQTIIKAQDGGIPAHITSDYEAHGQIEVNSIYLFNPEELRWEWHNVEIMPPGFYDENNEEEYGVIPNDDDDDDDEDDEDDEEEDDAD